MARGAHHVTSHVDLNKLYLDPDSRVMLSILKIIKILLKKKIKILKIFLSFRANNGRNNGRNLSQLTLSIIQFLPAWIPI